MLKVVAISCLTLTVIFGSVFLVRQATLEDTPERAISEINKALMVRDSSLLLPRVTNKPDYVAKILWENILKKMSLKTQRKYANPEKADSNSATPSFNPKFAGKELIERVVPTDLFFSHKRTITKVRSIRVKELEAVVQVELDGYDSENGAWNNPLIYDVLLYKEESKWKTFGFELRNRGDETYYRYSFYAKKMNMENLEARLR